GAVEARRRAGASPAGPSEGGAKTPGPPSHIGRIARFQFGLHDPSPSQFLAHSGQPAPKYTRWIPDTQLDMRFVIQPAPLPEAVLARCGNVDGPARIDRLTLLLQSRVCKLERRAVEPLARIVVSRHAPPRFLQRSRHVMVEADEGSRIQGVEEVEAVSEPDHRRQNSNRLSSSGVAALCPSPCLLWRILPEIDPVPKPIVVVLAPL